MRRVGFAKSNFPVHFAKNKAVRHICWGGLSFHDSRVIFIKRFYLIPYSEMGMEDSKMKLFHSLYNDVTT